MGEKIKEYRERLGLSQAELAEGVGVDRSSVSLWESGKTMPTIKNLRRLAALFSCKPGDLF